MYLKLRNREDGLSYYQHDTDDTECDFVVEHRDGTFEAVQVAYELNADNEEREVRGALHAMERFGLRESVLVTNNQEDLIRRDGKLVRVLPAWEWLK